MLPDAMNKSFPSATFTCLNLFCLNVFLAHTWQFFKIGSRLDLPNDVQTNTSHFHLRENGISQLGKSFSDPFHFIFA